MAASGESNEREMMSEDCLWVDDTHVYAETTDGLRASYAFSDWARLANATDAQRRDFYLSYGGIHWPQIDEDLSFECMFEDNGIPFAAEEEAEYHSHLTAR